MLEKWRASTILPISKKGDKTKCSNYRGVILLSITYKLLSNSLLSGFSPNEKNLYGFISVDFEATDQLLIVYSTLIKHFIKKMGMHRSLASELNRL